MRFVLEHLRLPVHRLLEDAASQRPGSPYIVFDDTALSYRQMDLAANRVSRFLIERGVGKGNRVALFLPNVPHFPIALFGLLKSGAIAVTCNPTYTAGELNRQLRDSGACCLFVLDHPRFYPAACEALRDTDVATVVYCGVGQYLPPLKRVLGTLLRKIPRVQEHAPDHIPFHRALAGRPPTAPDVDIAPDDLASIQYTGGTTGTPKGACLTHANLVCNLITARAWVRPGADPAHAQPLVDGGECFLGVLPWYHSYGLMMTLLAATMLQSRVVCVPDPYAGSPPFTDILRLIQKHRATVLNGVPTLFSTLIHHPLIDQFDLRSLKLCGSGAAPLPVELARQFEDKTGAILYEAYGLTETATMTHCNPTNRVERRLGSLGLPTPGTDAIIIDLETGLTELPRGEDGEIAICGPQVMTGYWQRPDETTQVFRDINGKRYFLTGDVGHVDPAGFFYLSDRKKDMVIVGGFKVYPREVEEVLYAHPDVAAAAVVGVPHARMGQALMAFVVLKAGATADKRQLVQYCKARLVGYKVPRLFEFRESLPMLPTGKVLKRALLRDMPAKDARGEGSG